MTWKWIFMITYLFIYPFFLFAAEYQPQTSTENTASEKIIGPHNCFLTAKSKESSGARPKSSSISYDRFTKISSEIHQLGSIQEPSIERFVLNIKFFFLISLYRFLDPIYEFDPQRDQIKAKNAACCLVTRILLKGFKGLLSQACSFASKYERHEKLADISEKITVAVRSIFNPETVLKAFNDTNSKFSESDSGVFLYKNLYRYFEDDLDQKLRDIYPLTSEIERYTTMLPSFMFLDRFYYELTPIALIDKYIYSDQYNHYCTFEDMEDKDIMEQYESRSENEYFIIFYDPIIIPLAVAFHYLLDKNDEDLCSKIGDRIAFTSRLRVLSNSFLEKNIGSGHFGDLIETVGLKFRTIPLSYEQHKNEKTVRESSFSKIFEGLKEGHEMIYHACMHISSEYMQLIDEQAVVFIKILSRSGFYKCIMNAPS